MWLICLLEPASSLSHHHECYKRYEQLELWCERKPYHETDDWLARHKTEIVEQTGWKWDAFQTVSPAKDVRL